MSTSGVRKGPGLLLNHSRFRCCVISWHDHYEYWLVSPGRFGEEFAWHLDRRQRLVFFRAAENLRAVYHDTVRLAVLRLVRSVGAKTQYDEVAGSGVEVTIV